MVECSRVVLPKPLGVKREAQIENRRQVHEKIYQDYRKEFCKKNGDQVENLTASEKKGLESLKKRIKKEEILVIKTDKSGKLSVTNREKYLEMGKEHVGDDKEVGRDEIKDTDRIMNEHSAAWCSIWRTGKDHSQEDRVRQSKVSKSENRAKLYLAHKDHKKEKEKTRPIGTANSSNTRAFANSVSELLEAVANSEDNKFEVISSEDMLYSVRASNLKVEDLRRTRPLKVQLKRRCWGCKVWKIGCSAHKEDDKGGKKSLEEEKEVESKLVRRRKSFPSLSLNLKAEKTEKIQKNLKNNKIQKNTEIKKEETQLVGSRRSSSDLKAHDNPPQLVRRRESLKTLSLYLKTNSNKDEKAHDNPKLVRRRKSSPSLSLNLKASSNDDEKLDWPKEPSLKEERTKLVRPWKSSSDLKALENEDKNELTESERLVRSWKSSLNLKTKPVRS